MKEEQAMLYWQEFLFRVLVVPWLPPQRWETKNETNETILTIETEQFPESREDTPPIDEIVYAVQAASPDP